MQQWRMPVAWILVALFVGSLGVLPARAQQAADNASQDETLLDRLDTDRLGRAMVKLKMGKLLEAVAQETGDQDLELSAIILRAETAPLAERDGLLARSAELMKKRAADLARQLPDLKETNPVKWEETLVEHYRLRLRFIETQYLNRGRPYVDRFNFLLGAKADREFLGKLTADAPGEIISLQRDIVRSLEDSRGDLTLLVTLVPELDGMDRQLKYKGAFVYRTAALGLPKLVAPEGATGAAAGATDASAPEQPAADAQPTVAAANLVPNDERRSLLNRAIGSIEPYATATNPDYQGWEPYARLLKARCHRSLGEFAEAEGLLNWCAGDESEPAVVGDALFELARNKAEWGAAKLVVDKQSSAAEEKFRTALAAVDTLVKYTRENRGELAADVRKLMLDAYIYDLWADALRGVGQADQAAEKSSLSQGAYVTFLEKHPEPAARAALYNLIAPKFEDVKDYTTLNPVILLVLAIGRFNEAMAVSDPTAQSEALADPQKMFEVIRDNETPAAAKAEPDALWYLGVIYNQQLDLFKSVEAFRQLASKYPEHPLAYDAAKNAVSLLYQQMDILQEKNEAVPAALREQLVQSLELILTRWPDEPGAVQYHFDLGWQASQLATEAPTAEEEQQWLTKAIDNYKKVPETDRLYLWAKGLGLELEARRLLNTADASTQKTQAPDLYQRLMAYGKDVHEKLPTMEKDSKERNDLATSASTVEFLAQRIRYEAMNDQTKAIAAIEDLSVRWPGTDVLRESQEYLIRKLVEGGDVNGAVQQLQNFEKAYGPEQAEDLMAVVIDGLSSQIQKLVADAEVGNADELEKYRQAYLSFARKYYDLRKAGANEEEKYQITLLLADALIQSGTQDNAKQALTLLQQLRSIEENRRKKREAEIDTYINGLLAKVDRAGDVVSSIQLLKKDWDSAVEKFSATDWEQGSSVGTMIRHTWQQLKMIQSGEDVAGMTAQKAAEQFRAAIRRGYDKLRPVAKRTIARNATVFLNMAHCERLLGQYTKAAEMYREVISGLSPTTHRNMYGEAQLGYVQSLFGANMDNADQLRKLDEYISQAKSTTKDMWNRERFLPQFNQLQAQIRQQIAKIGG